MADEGWHYYGLFEALGEADEHRPCECPDILLATGIWRTNRTRGPRYFVQYCHLCDAATIRRLSNPIFPRHETPIWSTATDDDLERVRRIVADPMYVVGLTP